MLWLNIYVSCELGRPKIAVHKKIIYVHTTTLEEAKYKLKKLSTALNISYQHCGKFPIYGTGQGSGNSPMIWCYISRILFDCHNQQAHGIILLSLNRDTTVSFSIINFVDDLTCITRGKHNETIEQLLVQAKVDAQLWHNLLWSSGDKLELQKCNFHIIFHNFDNNRVPSMRNIEEHVISLTNEKGKAIQIRTKKIDEARKNLGHWKKQRR